MSFFPEADRELRSLRAELQETRQMLRRLVLFCVPAQRVSLGSDGFAVIDPGSFCWNLHLADGTHVGRLPVDATSIDNKLVNLLVLTDALKKLSKEFDLLTPEEKDRYRKNNRAQKMEAL